MKKIVVITIAFILLPVLAYETEFTTHKAKINYTCRKDATAVIVSKENPFYALIATPVALYYDDDIHVKPLLVENISNPSDAITRFKELYGLQNAIVITNEEITEASINLATQIWESSDEAIIIKNDFDGYSIGINLVALASYKAIPVFVANNLNEILPTLKQLGVKTTYVCGDIKGYGNVVEFKSEEEAYEYLMDFVKQKFGGVNYIVMSNPLDIKEPKVLDSVEYDFRSKTGSVAILPAQSFHALFTQQFFNMHEFEIPDYKYARVKVDLVNLDSENVKELGDGIFLMIINPDGKPYVYTATGAGLAEYDENGDITQDKVHYEFIICNEPGIYTARVIGRWFADVEGEYELKIKVEEIDTPIDPLMNGLSSLASYLAAYHHGIVFALPSFAFAGTQGMSQPGDNPDIIQECNEHVMDIHNKLNELLAEIANLPDNVATIWQHYKENPIYIAILADATMIPIYYYKNPDDGYIMGFGVPGDFIYGDVDPKLDDTENDTFTYYPFQENAVGRLTGYDAEDCSALIARTIFYDEIIEKLGEWRQNATVQTGTGIEFQYIPLITPAINRLKSVIGFGPVRQEPTKFPTGESKFINDRICHDFENSGFNVFSAHRLEAQRTGLMMDRKGGEYQLKSNYIFAFDHGCHYLYEAGDMLELDQFGLGLKTGLSGKGSYDIRHVINMPYKPSVAFIESCLVGKIEGLSADSFIEDIKKLLKEFNVEGTIICESPILEEDAIKIKNILKDYGIG